MTVGFIQMLGPWELGLILLLVLMVFGAGKLPHVMRQLGRSVGMLRELDGGDEPKA